MTTETRVEQLKSEIETLEPMEGTAGLVTEKRAELAKLEGSAVPTAKKKGDKGMEEEGKNLFDLDVTPEELDEVNDGLPKRPPVGNYAAEWQKAKGDYSTKAAKMPFIITEKGRFEDFEDAFYPAFSAPFSIKNLAIATGVEPRANPKTGKAQYDLDDFMGKPFIARYEEEEGEIDLSLIHI